MYMCISHYIYIYIHVYVLYVEPAGLVQPRQQGAGLQRSAAPAVLLRVGLRYDMIWNDVT